MRKYLVKNTLTKLLIFTCILPILPMVGCVKSDQIKVTKPAEFDNLEDLEVSNPRPVQERDIKSYPLASMYYQHMHKSALKALENLRKNCDQMAKSLGNIQCNIPDIKEFERTIEKINIDYHGDFKQVLDIYRGSIVVENFEALRAAITEFKKYYKISQTKNRFKHPLDSGYRDFMAIFYDEEQKIYGEMQFHLCHIITFKEQAHEFYEKIRSIEGKAKLEQRELNQQEKEDIAILTEKSKKGYEQAFFDSLNGKKCSSADFLVKD